MKINKKIILLNIPYLLFFFLGNKLSYIVRTASGNIFTELINRLSEIIKPPLLSFYPVDLLIGIACIIAVKAFVYVRGKNAKKYRKGIEYGSARWSHPKDIVPYTDKDFSKNIILTETEYITLDSRQKNNNFFANKNVMVVGSSASGKTRFFIKPNIMQMHSSYVVTDPKGTIITELGYMLKKGGYDIKSLNTVNFNKSMHYNPFVYIKSEKDILKLVNTLIENTKGDCEKSGEDFWIKAEKLLYQAYIGYIWYEAPEEEKNFLTLLDMLNSSEAREDDESFKSPVDMLFDSLEQREPEHFAVRQYKKYKLAAGVVCYKRLIYQYKSKRNYERSCA